MKYSEWNKLTRIEKEAAMLAYLKKKHKKRAA